MPRLLSLSLLLLLALGLAAGPAANRSWADEEKSAKQSDSTDKADDDEGDRDDDDGDDDKSDGDKDSKKPAKKAEKPRKTAEVEEKPLRVEVTVDGTFVAREMTPVALRPETWKGFKIEEIVPHGATVREGEVLVRFESKALNEEIADLELSGRLADLAIRKAEQELPRVERSLEMALADAEQAHERITDDYARYKDVGRDRLIEQAEMNLKMSRQRLDYSRDELEQLEKMYEADDLTEETEEIILTRTRQQVEFAEYFYEMAKIRHDEMMSIYLPRQDEDNREVVERVDMSLERAKLASQIDLNRARYELEQMKIRRDKSRERHAKLIQDRALMELKSPADGIVYYGSCTAGKWGDMATMIAKLVPHKSVPPGAVMMTIVEPDPIYLLATVGEKERPTLEPGQPAKVRPTAEGAASLAGSVASVSMIPVSKGKFSLEVDLTADGAPEWLVPGMSGKIRVTTYDKKDALVVNKKAVHAEEDDDEKQYVWLVEGGDGDQTVKKQRVKTGKSKGDLIEITSGLDAGDVVSLEDEDKQDDED